MTDQAAPGTGRITTKRPGRATMSSTWLGLLGAFALLYFVLGTEGDMRAFLNRDGMAIVLGGVAVVALLAFRFSEIFAAITALFVIFREEQSLAGDVAELVAIARHLHSHDVQKADELLAGVGSPFLRLGLQLVIDGAPIEDLMHVLTWRIQKLAERENGQARLFRTLASFSPAFGLLGTLVGMVGMLKQLGGGDIGKIGDSMAVAMLATLYGLICANLIFKPIAIKLEQRTMRRVAMLNVLLEGVMLTRLGRSPGLIAEAMDHLLRETKDEVRGGR